MGNETGQRQTPQRFELRKFKSGDFFFLGQMPPSVPPTPKPKAVTATMGGYELETIDRRYRAVITSNVRRGAGIN